MERKINTDAELMAANSDLLYYERIARKALEDGAMGLHMAAGREFHMVADALAEATGLDPRDSAIEFLVTA